MTQSGSKSSVSVGLAKARVYLSQTSQACCQAQQQRACSCAAVNVGRLVKQARPRQERQTGPVVCLLAVEMQDEHTAKSSRRI